MADPADTTYWTQGDTWPPLRFQLADENGPMDTTLAGTIVFVAKKDATTILGTATAMATDGDGFNVSYTWKAGDLNVPGTYQCEAEVRWTATHTERFGSSDLPSLVVRAKLA